MNVLHVAPSVARAFGGPTHSLAGYVGAARALGAECEVAAPTVPAVDAAWLGAAMPGVRLHTFASRGAGAFAFSAPLLDWLRRHARGYDVVHVHGLLNPISSFAARLCLRAGVPVVVRPFGTLSRYTVAHRRGLAKRAYIAALDGPNLRRVQGVHFTTEAEAAEAAWHGIPLGGRSFVVPPPCAAESAAAPAPAARPTVLFLARLHPIKHLEALIDAWPAVRRAVPDAHLVVAGEGDPGYVRTLRQRVAGVGAAGSVEFAGFVTGPTKAALLASAHAFVLPSFHENFGNAVLDALAAGLPVVVTPEVQLSTFVHAYGLGVVTDPSPPALARALVRALRDETLRAHCRSDGPARVTGSFSQAAVGRGLMQMYAAVAGRPPPAPPARIAAA